MTNKIHTPVTVNFLFNHKTKMGVPTSLMWQQKVYKLEHYGMHYTYKDGDTLYHVFTATSGNINFKVVLNTRSLNWILEEVYDTNLR